jgi:hypothetical protein
MMTRVKTRLNSKLDCWDPLEKDRLAIKHFVRCMTFSSLCGLMQETTVSYCLSFVTEKYVAGPRLLTFILASCSDFTCMRAVDFEMMYIMNINKPANSNMFVTRSKIHSVYATRLKFKVDKFSRKR